MLPAIFNNQPIRQEAYDDKTWISLTDCAKAIDARQGRTKLKDIFNTESYKDYVSLLLSESGFSLSQFLLIIRGNAKNNALPQGTWLNISCTEGLDLLIYVAQRMSPAFHVWCNKHITQLAQHTSLDMHNLISTAHCDEATKQQYFQEMQNKLSKIEKYEKAEQIGLGDVSLTLNTDLLSIADGKVVTDTLILAEVFEKEHKHVLRDIQELIGPNLDSLASAELSSFYAEHFIASTYTDSRGRTQPKFLLTREGFSLLAMGFTGAKAQLFKIRYIQAFEAMYNQLRGYAMANFLGRTDGKKLIYVIKNSMTGLVKIGITNDLKRRINQLECATGCELECLFVMPASDNAGQIERAIHKQFDAQRQRGEWFAIKADQAIEALTKQTLKLC